jgi:hypothetical protein
MATNVRDPQSRDEIHDETLVTEPASAVRPAGGSGVAVYDRNPAQPIDPALRPASPASSLETTPVSGGVPVEPRSTGSIIGWFIGAVILIVLVYFLLQMLF